MEQKVRYFQLLIIFFSNKMKGGKNLSAKLILVLTSIMRLMK